ncbi:HsdM family class I SAM-dependent methyltransferase [Schaalia georgiae]|uniref:HsdM family class I SAM-dependent methyltransferase n=1 Tax=Schaalia georgiae TaxID=52768 RepID=UPI00040B8D59|nr:N-6 DNA methylase [Schaalia georgiae]
MGAYPTTEDEVREYAGSVLGFSSIDTSIVKAGVGQVTTLKQLGFTGEGASLKPDGWYLPHDRGLPAIVLETKARGIMPIDSPALKAQVERYSDVIRARYDLVVGIVYDGEQVRAYLNGQSLDVSDELQPAQYYIDRLMDQPIDKERIYELTMRINNSLHGDFGIKNLYHRMIFTACALVARRYDAILVRGMDYADFHNGILSALNKAIRFDKEQNSKLQLLADVYSEIKMNVSTDDDDPRAVQRLTNLIGDFIDWITEISGLINSSAWDGEDVMAIFFNEFNRYKKKSESGQVFTPDHVTGFMYRLLEVSKNDYVLDACAGSGSFLVKSMSNMIREAGGVGTRKARQIKREQLYGIEFDREIYALACANMLIHKDGKTNLAHMDARTETASEWMQETGATKVLMNPPYENKFGCMKIVENVLNSVNSDVLCGFVLPDKKLEKTPKRQMARILRHHRLITVVKMPENLFFGIGITTSIFIFRAGVPQDNKEFFAVNIAEDGLVTVKNKGRHDVHNRWPELEDYWVDAISKHDDSRFGTGQWHSTDECMSWQVPVKQFEITEGDFARTAMEYLMFQRGVDAAATRERLGVITAYIADITEDDAVFRMEIKK